MTRPNSIGIAEVVLVLFVLLVGGAFASLCGGCSAPAVQVNKVYIVHQHGTQGNRVDVEVSKDEQITPTVKAGVK